jgi:hypothetical protein
MTSSISAGGLSAPLPLLTIHSHVPIHLHTHIPAHPSIHPSIHPHNKNTQIPTTTHPAGLDRHVRVAALDLLRRFLQSGWVKVVEHHDLGAGFRLEFGGGGVGTNNNKGGGLVDVRAGGKGF